MYSRPRLTALSTAKARATYLGAWDYRALGDPASGDTQADVNALVAQLQASGQWSDKELSWITAQLSSFVGVPYVVDGLTRIYANNLGTLTIAPYAANFSLPTGDTQQDIDNAFLDSYGSQLDVPYGRWQQQTDGSWRDPFTGQTLSDVMYHASVHIQQILNQAYASKDYANVESALANMRSMAPSANR